jgi:hypothetical protein
MTVARRVWRDLEGLFADDVLHAPKTYGDPAGVKPPVDGRVVAYLQRNVAGTPWADQLVLLAVILTARRRDTATIVTTLVNLNSRFRTIFGELELHSFTDWNPNVIVPAYLKGEICKSEGEGVRQRFWVFYNAASRQMTRWSESLPASEQHRYAAFLLPLTDRWLVEDLLRNTQLQRQAEEARKADTDALLPYLMDIRATAHLRYNLLARVRQAYRAAVAHVQTLQADLPYTFALGSCRRLMPPPNTSRRRATPRGGAARPDSGVADMSRQIANCERCTEFSRELLELQQRVDALGLADVCTEVPARSAGSTAAVNARSRVPRYAKAMVSFVQVMRHVCRGAHL